MKSLESDDTRNTDTVCPGWEKDDQVTENSADIAIYLYRERWRDGWMDRWLDGQLSDPFYG